MAITGGGITYSWIPKKAQRARENVVRDKAEDLGKHKTLQGLVHNTKELFIPKDIIRFYTRRLTRSDVCFEKTVLATVQRGIRLDMSRLIRMSCNGPKERLW